jgi:DNA-binding NtrC family response regulator
VAEAIDALMKYPWPGNIRELRNIVERLLLLATSDVVDLATVEVALPKSKADGQTSLRTSDSKLSHQVEQFERAVILAALEEQKHHITNTAKVLGLERSHLYKKCQQLGVNLRK